MTSDDVLAVAEEEVAPTERLLGDLAEESGTLARMQAICAAIEPSWLDGLLTIASGVAGGTIALVGANIGDRRRARSEHRRDARERAFKYVHEFHSALVAAQISAGKALGIIVVAKLEPVAEQRVTELGNDVDDLSRQTMAVTSTWSVLCLAVPADDQLAIAAERARHLLIKTVVEVTKDRYDLVEQGRLTDRRPADWRGRQTGVYISPAFDVQNDLVEAVTEFQRASVRFLDLPVV